MQLSLLSNYTIIEARFRLLFSLSRSTFGCPLLAVPMPPRGEEKKGEEQEREEKRGRRRRGILVFLALRFGYVGFGWVDFTRREGLDSSSTSTKGDSANAFRRGNVEKPLTTVSPTRQSTLARGMSFGGAIFDRRNGGREEPPVISSINNLDGEDTWRRLIAYVNQPIPIIKSTVIPDIEVETRSLMSLFLTDSAFDRRRKSRSF